MSPHQSKIIFFILFSSSFAFAADDNILCPPVDEVRKHAAEIDMAYTIGHGNFTAYTSAPVFSTGQHQWQIINLLENMTSEEQAITQAKINCSHITLGLNYYAEIGMKYATCYYIPYNVRAVTKINRLTH